MQKTQGQSTGMHPLRLRPPSRIFLSGEHRSEACRHVPTMPAPRKDVRYSELITSRARRAPFFTGSSLLARTIDTVGPGTWALFDSLWGTDGLTSRQRASDASRERSMTRDTSRSRPPCRANESHHRKPDLSSPPMQESGTSASSCQNRRTCPRRMSGGTK